MSKKIVLKTSDKQIFEVDQSVVEISQTIMHLIDDHCAEQTIPLPNITGAVFAKVLEYCKKHSEKADVQAETAAEESSTALVAGAVDAELEVWDTEFLKDVKDSQSYAGLSELTLAANFLNIPRLLELTVQTYADLIKDLSVEQARGVFNIENDFTPDEEAQLRKEISFAYED